MEHYQWNFSPDADYLCGVFARVVMQLSLVERVWRTPVIDPKPAVTHKRGGTLDALPGERGLATAGPQHLKRIRHVGSIAWDEHPARLLEQKACRVESHQAPGQ